MFDLIFVTLAVNLHVTHTILICFAFMVLGVWLGFFHLRMNNNGSVFNMQ